MELKPQKPGKLRMPWVWLVVLLAERHEAVRHLLADKREQLDQLTQRLLKEESIDQEVLTQILGARAECAQQALQ